MLRSFDHGEMPATQQWHDTLNSWWGEREGHVVPLELWPARRRLVLYDGAPAAAYFLLVDPPYTMMSFYVSNPNFPPLIRGTAISRMIEFFLEEAKTNRCTIAFISCQYRGMISLLKRRGFKAGDTDVTHLLKVL